MASLLHPRGNAPRTINPPAAVAWLGTVLLFVYPFMPQLDAAIDHALGLPLQMERLFVSMFVFALLSLSVHVQFGLGGMMQLGSAAWFGIGAYVFGIATVEKLPFQCAPAVALLWCTMLGALSAATVGAVCARMRGDAVGMATLAFGEMWRAAALNAEGITDGSRGLNPLPSPVLPGFVSSLFAIPAARSPFIALYLMALCAVVVASVVIARLARGPFGRALCALRADPLAAEAMGIDTRALRIQAMAFGGALAAGGGGLYASYLTTTAEPSTYDFNVSVMALCAVVVGGIGSTRGAIVGAIFVVFFDTALGPLVDAMLQHLVGADLADLPWASFGQWRWLLFGALLIATMHWRPQGLCGRRV